MTDSNGPGERILWARVEDGFHVGSRSGDFIGSIDRIDEDVFEASDSRSRLVGRFPTLRAAIDAVAAAVDAPVKESWFLR